MKKTLAFILAIALLCMMAVGTTLTYFTDTDFDKNTMTVGKVDIEQIENFTNNSALRPYIGTPVADTNGLWDTNKNAVTKTVTVENKTGSEAAYIRTLFAFEAVNNANPVGREIHVNYNTDTNVGTWTPMGSVVVNEVTYYVYAFTYVNAVNGGVTTAASLKQIALDCNEGNNFSGGEYEILVVSQAVQAQGFTAAEGKTAAEVALSVAFPLGENNTIPANWFPQN